MGPFAISFKRYKPEVHYVRPAQGVLWPMTKLVTIVCNKIRIKKADLTFSDMVA